MIDISLSLQSKMPIWPSDPALRVERFQRIEDGSIANVSQMQCGVHIGTHVDAPFHFVQDGKTVEQLNLGTLIGPAYVVYLPELDTITATALDGLQLPEDLSRLLLRTRNSEWWVQGENAFREDYVALDSTAAQWLVDRGIKLIGIDYLSIQRFHDGPLTHQILLQAEVVILEGLNLSMVQPGAYELLCLPLKLVGADGAPARALLRPLL
jgi:arylformamidase